MEYIAKFFKIEENNTTIKTELLAGLTTFFTMSYLFILSPKILASAGLDFSSTLTITALFIFIGCMLMGLFANKPYAVAPFLGETAFIAFTICSTLGFSIKTALAAIVVCGVILLFMTLFNLRAYIVNQIPEAIKVAFCTGLGLFFIFIALKDMGIVNFTQNPIPLETGNFTQLPILLSIVSFLILITLVKRNVQAAVLISIITSTVLGILIGDVQLPEKIISLPSSPIPSLLQTDFSGLLNKNFIPMFFVIFLLINIDTAGALIGLSYKTETNNSNENQKKPMLVDSLCVILAPLMGTTTPGAYLDSMTGINAGGRTGLTAITVGTLFLLGLLFTPVITIIPPYAYAPALLYVGILMTTVIAKTNFEDISEFAPIIFTICAMIFTYNIGSGIIAGFIIYPLTQVLCGQKNKTNIISWILFVLSIIYFIIYPY